MPGDSYHDSGGVDGKSWGCGSPAARPGPANGRSDAGATVIRSGQSQPNQSTQASIQPPGKVSSWTGVVESTGGRVVFQTSGCGSWRLVD